MTHVLTHGALTEGSSSDSRQEGRGREGRGDRKVVLHASLLTTRGPARLPRRPATLAASCKTSGEVEVDLSDLESCGDGRHHLWCKVCHPEWAARPLGAELAVPFIAVCGARVVILARWQSRVDRVRRRSRRRLAGCRRATCGSL